MATIRLTHHQAGLFLHVKCFESFTRIFPSTSDRERLEAAIAVTLGAKMEKVSTDLVDVSPAGVADGATYDFDYLLEVNENNLLALRATGFDWDGQASKLASEYSASEEAIASLREAIEVYLKKQQEEMIEMMSTARGTTNKDLHHVTASNKQKRWWQFWMD